MEVLLELGADPFIANVDGDTPLMVAAGVGVYSQGESPGQPEESADAVKMLLDSRRAGERRGSGTARQHCTVRPGEDRTRRSRCS